MAITNHERVGKALELLKDGLRPFVEARTKSPRCPGLAEHCSRVRDRVSGAAVYQGVRSAVGCDLPTRRDVEPVERCVS